MTAEPEASPTESPTMAPRPASALSAPDQRRDLLARDLGLIGNDPSWRQVIELGATIALGRSPVLIAGEPGTGKSQLARLIHAMGLGTDRPFIACDAAAMADDLASDDEEDDRHDGPPTLPADSAALWAGRRNLARGGSLFIDDVADLPLTLQLHLLRDLQAPDYGASGGDVRFLLSTGESLPALIEQGRFRQELYHRIGVVVLSPPPLRHRGTDIELLAELFRERYAQEFHKNVVGFTRDALDLLQRHDWPGNVRELEAAIQRAVALCNGTRVSSNQPRPDPQPPPTGPRRRAGRHPEAPRPHGDPIAEGGPRGAREADHHPGPPGVQLEPPGDRPRPRHQPHDPLQEDEEVRPAHRRADVGPVSRATRRIGSIHGRISSTSRSPKCRPSSTTGTFGPGLSNDRLGPTEVSATPRSARRRRGTPAAARWRGPPGIRGRSR